MSKFYAREEFSPVWHIVDGTARIGTQTTGFCKWKFVPIENATKQKPARWLLCYGCRAATISGKVHSNSMDQEFKDISIYLE